MSKGIAIHATTLAVMIVRFLFFPFIVFFVWMNWQKGEATKAACTAKYINYCTEWYNENYDPAKRPFDWDSTDPKGCEKDPINVYEPKTKEDCAFL